MVDYLLIDLLCRLAVCTACRLITVCCHLKMPCSLGSFTVSSDIVSSVYVTCSYMTQIMCMV